MRADFFLFLLVHNSEFVEDRSTCNQELLYQNVFNCILGLNELIKQDFSREKTPCESVMTPPKVAQR